jgi:protein involved in polysaccharide export with SLBB domain
MGKRTHETIGAFEWLRGGQTRGEVADIRAARVRRWFASNPSAVVELEDWR